MWAHLGPIKEVSLIQGDILRWKKAAEDTHSTPHPPTVIIAAVNSLFAGYEVRKACQQLLSESGHCLLRSEDGSPDPNASRIGILNIECWHNLLSERLMMGKRAQPNYAQGEVNSGVRKMSVNAVVTLEGTIDCTGLSGLTFWGYFEYRGGHISGVQIRGSSLHGWLNTAWL